MFPAITFNKLETPVSELLTTTTFCLPVPLFLSCRYRLAQYQLPSTNDLDRVNFLLCALSIPRHSIPSLPLSRSPEFRSSQTPPPTPPLAPTPTPAPTLAPTPTPADPGVTRTLCAVKQLKNCVVSTLYSFLLRPARLVLRLEAGVMTRSRLSNLPLPLSIQPRTPFLRKGATRTFKKQLDPSPIFSHLPRNNLILLLSSRTFQEPTGIAKNQLDPPPTFSYLLAPSKKQLVLPRTNSVLLLPSRTFQRTYHHLRVVSI
ncbi:hypothetical protein [Absidia glauca]|uniref:Uncharacterized protein n=1 Tax=Absidia glauca TaxID=4829 RepID=A0A168L9P5_ABSGL|nr:hypothetical protein [Absidia glauca]